MENGDFVIKEMDCTKYLRDLDERSPKIDLTFFDPPFNQGKEYRKHDDKMENNAYWAWMKEVCRLTLNHTSEGGAIYFMQREKNTEHVLRVLKEAGWTFQNLIIWKKMTSAVPIRYGFNKSYQIIAFATKGDRPRVFNKLRIEPPRRVTDKYERPDGTYINDVWDDIRELTSGYFAGNEPLRINGERAHEQQSPIALLLRIILSSTNIGDSVFDPFAGTGTALVVAKQIGRKSLGVELDPENVKLIKDRLNKLRESDNVLKYYKNYARTPDLTKIWPSKESSLKALVEE